MSENYFDSIIIGGGAAGLTAGIYLARGKASVLILDTATIGGQMILTHKIANYPGVEETSGYELSSLMKKQASSFGCKIKSNVKVENLLLTDDLKEVELSDGSRFSAKTIILATGGRSRMLNVPGEKKLKGRGISYCATCDGDFFQDKEIIVVGGGNSAMEEAVSLTKYASRVSILHEFDHFQAFEHAVEEAKSNPKIDFIMESHITEFIGDTKLEAVKYKNLKTNEVSTKNIDGVFIFIGYEPNTDALVGTGIELNQWGEVLTNDMMETNIKGVYAAGDLRQKRVRQVTTAVADGTIAAVDALNKIHK
ncbi:MAG: pyridine nucleotide-disulfide oxidoreductase [Marinilabiliales bacterium]|nr:MAG: pyridine nucleotide-disulfide oxidoreductase [Marinilabiliales bacterium]